MIRAVRLSRETQRIMKPGSPAWKARRAQLLADEIGQPMRWFWLSFASKEGFLGAAMVRACGWMHAVERADKLGINPGGEVKVDGPIPPFVPVPKEARNRLMSREDVERIFGVLEKWE